MTAPDNYTSASGISYSFNNIPLGFADAEAICNTQCGHLAAYPNLPEQNDVEQYYIGRVSAVTHPQPARTHQVERRRERQHASRYHTPVLPLAQGLIIPAYHTSYWMGLSVPMGLAWPDFEWVTPDIPGPASPYLNWGFPAQGPEPNEPGTGCAVAVGETARGSPTGWGWGDASCGESHFFICRKSGEARRRQPAPMLACRHDSAAGRAQTALYWQQFQVQRCRDIASADGLLCPSTPQPPRPRHRTRP
jgi:hypothetical protein